MTAPTACKRMVSGSFSLPYLGFFLPFLHSTRSLSVFREYLALRFGHRRFIQDFTCPALLRWQTINITLTRKGVSPASPYLSRYFRLRYIYFMSTPTTPTTPQCSWFRLYPVRSPLLRVSIFLSFPTGT